MRNNICIQQADLQSTAIETDITDLGRLHWRQQFKALIAIAGLSIEEVAVILEVTTDRISNFLREELEPFRTDSALDRHADLLLSLMWKMLHISLDTKSGLRGLINSCTTDDQSLCPPPWVCIGLKQYLLEGGLSALKNSIIWFNRF